MTVRQGFMIDASVDFDDGVAFAAEHDFDFVELNMEHPFFRELDPERVRSVTSDCGLGVVAHLPYRVDIGSPHEHVREGACRQLEAALETAAACGAETGVFHATTTVSAEGWGAETLREIIYESVRRVDAYASDAGVTGAVENVKRPYFDAGDFPDLFDATDAAACLDTGHAHAMGYDGADQAGLIEAHGDRIAHLHLNETRQPDRDEHLPLGHGRVDFRSVARALVETGWSGTCTHEIYSWDLDSRASSKAVFDELLADARA
jgi:sugar phosphate isomerase/epimerase